MSRIASAVSQVVLLGAGSDRLAGSFCVSSHTANPGLGFRSIRRKSPLMSISRDSVAILRGRSMSKVNRTQE